MAVKKVPRTPPPTWAKLNDSLRGCTEFIADELLAEGRRSKWPKTFLIRIQKRANVLHRARAMKELEKA
jgi:hypothetical protein